MTRLAPGIPFTSCTWMVRSGTGENLLTRRAPKSGRVRGMISSDAGRVNSTAGFEIPSRGGKL